MKREVCMVGDVRAHMPVRSKEEMDMTKRKLALAVTLATVGSMWMGAASAAEKAAEMDSYELAPVEVEGERPAPAKEEQETLPGGFVRAKPAVGLLGEQSVMDVPLAVTEVSRKTLDTFATPTNGVNGALSLNPAVRVQTGHLYQDISIRGFRINGHASYTNGVPGMFGQMNLPFYWVDRVSVIAGPNIGVSGAAINEAAAGTINYISKRAERDAVEAKISYLGGKSVEEAVDVSNRFGRDDRYGVRVTATNQNGETAVKHEKMDRQTLFVNLDQRTAKSTTNFLMGYVHTKQNAGPSRIAFDFGPGKVTHLPRAPKLSRSYKPAWSYNAYDNVIMTLNHEQKLSAHLCAFFNAGYHHEDWYGYIDGSPKVINDAGDFTISEEHYPLAFSRYYLNVGLKGSFRTGDLTHDYMLSADQNWARSYGGTYRPFTWSGTGNIYRDNSWAAPALPETEAPYQRKTRLRGWHVVDTIKTSDERTQVTLGLHGHNVHIVQASGVRTDTSAISPMVAVSYRATPAVTAYAAHTESFGLGQTVATGRGYANQGDMLDPAKTKQNEIGVKVRAGNFLHTLSYFEIRQANAIDVMKAGHKYLQYDGEQKNKGVEWGFTGTLMDKWDLIGGITYLDARQSRTKNGINDGKRVDGMPYWSSTLGIVYRPTTAWSLIGRVNYMGESVMSGGKIDVPSHLLFDLGATYRTTMGRTPVTLSAMLCNVTGKDYWNPRGDSTSLGLGEPRTFTFSANFEI